MQVSVETTRNVERSMKVGIPKERLQPQVQDRLKSLARKTKIKGFRPGKVPLRVIEQRYGQKVREEIAGEVIQASFGEALAQENLRPAGVPSFNLDSEIKNLEQGLSYTATFEIYPQITTLHADGLAVEKPVAEITDADVDTLLYRLRQQRQTWNDVDRQAGESDRVIIDCVGTIDGKSLKDNEFKQVPVILGANNFVLPGFEEKLMGAGKGDEREFDLSFPDEHKNPELAGNSVHFVVKVSKVSEPQVPEIDEDYIKKFGVEDGKIETLRTEARHNMERELKYAVEGKVKRQVLDALLEANPIEEVPKSLVEEKSQQLFKARQREWQNQNQNLNLSADIFKDEARYRVKIGFLVGEIIRKHNIQANPDRVRQFIEQMASVYEDTEAMVRKYYEDEQRLKEVESIVLEDEVVAWLLERAQINEKRMDFFAAVDR